MNFMKDDENYCNLLTQKMELEDHLSKHLPDPEVFVPGPSKFGLLEQKTLIVAHVKHQRVKLPEHFTHAQPNSDVFLSHLLMWVGEQGIVLPAAFYKTSESTPLSTSVCIS